MEQDRLGAHGASESRAGICDGLRVARTSLVGREHLLAAAVDLLRRDDVRMLVLIGPGGVGKTRLAVRIAEEVAAEFVHGVTCADLCSVRDPALLPRTVHQALGLRATRDEPPLDAIVRALAERDLLLLLDNLEHLIAAAPDIGRMIASAPRVKVLITSRERVSLSEAHHLQIPPLALPEGDDMSSAVDGAPAVRLFVDRAQAIDDQFALTPRNADAVAKVCRRLDGLPLAIELAAARANTLPPQAMLDRLDHALPLLTQGPVDAAERHRTMRAAIAWGYDLLDPARQRLFRRLSVFQGGFTLEAAEYVGGEGGAAALDHLTALIDRSLVRRVDDERDETPVRFRMLETLREFGRDALACDADEERQTLERHAAWVLQEVTAQARDAFSLLDESLAFTRLDPETGNIRAALAHVIAAGDAETALRLLGNLWLYWTTRGSLRVDELWVDRVLAMPSLDEASAAARADGVAGAAWVKALRGDGAKAAELATAAIVAARDARDLAAEAWATTLVSMAHGVQGKAGAAQATAAEAVALGRRAESRDWLPFALDWQGMALAAAGNPAAALPLVEEALTRWRENGFGWGIGTALEHLGLVARQSGDWGRAVGLFHEQLRRRGDPRNAWGVVHILGGLAEIAVAVGDPARGARLLGAVGRMLEESGIALTTTQVENRERARTAARLTLGEDRFLAEDEAGRALAFDAVLAEALAVRVPRDGMPPDVPAGLSPREVEALQLLAAGHTDREIAERLFLSVRTVESHLASARRKLGVSNRTEAAAAVFRLGLTGELTTDSGSQ